MLLYFRFHLCFCLVLLPRIFARLSTEGKIRFRRLRLLFCLVLLNALRYKERIEERRLKRLSRRSYLFLLSVRFHYNVCAIVQTLFYSVIVFCFIAMRQTRPPDTQKYIKYCISLVTFFFESYHMYKWSLSFIVNRNSYNNPFLQTNKEVKSDAVSALTKRFFLFALADGRSTVDSGWKNNENSNTEYGKRGHSFNSRSLEPLLSEWGRSAHTDLLRSSKSYPLSNKGYNKSPPISYRPILSNPIPILSANLKQSSSYTSYNLRPQVPCNVVIDKSVFYLQSPHFPQQYPANLHCLYTIKRALGSCSIELDIRDFYLEPTLDCSRDWLLVGERKYCGLHRPRKRKTHICTNISQLLYLNLEKLSEHIGKLQLSFRSRNSRISLSSFDPIISTNFADFTLPDDKFRVILLFPRILFDPLQLPRYRLLIHTLLGHLICICHHQLWLTNLKFLLFPQ